MVSTHPSAKTRVFTEKEAEKLDIFSEMELVKKETSVQLVGCSKCPDSSPCEKVSIWKRCAVLEDQVAKLQESAISLYTSLE